MRKRIRISEGDVFEVTLHKGRLGYFQFLMLDEHQLDSEIIRVFKAQFDPTDIPNPKQVVTGNVHFYAHKVIRLGSNLNLWNKVGNVHLEANLHTPSFRCSEDYGNPEIRISSNWKVWRANDESCRTENLSLEQKAFDIGVIVAPNEIVEKMNNGKFSYFYPSFE